jgi:hypothetical protein
VKKMKFFMYIALQIKKKKSFNPRKFAICIFLILAALKTPASAATFKGKVIDADTKQPIEGAVVVASWGEERATPTGSTTDLHDVKEALTSQNGEWIIDGPKGRELGNLSALFTLLTGSYITNPPQFLIFKPGYCPWPDGFMINACADKIKPNGHHEVANGQTAELSRLTDRKDRLKASRIWPPLRNSGGDPATLKKIKNFIRLLNEEHRYLGLQEMYKEIGNEK